MGWLGLGKTVASDAAQDLGKTVVNHLPSADPVSAFSDSGKAGVGSSAVRKVEGEAHKPSSPFRRALRRHALQGTVLGLGGTALYGAGKGFGANSLDTANGQALNLLPNPNQERLASSPADRSKARRQAHRDAALMAAGGGAMLGMFLGARKRGMLPAPLLSAGDRLFEAIRGGVPIHFQTGSEVLRLGWEHGTRRGKQGDPLLLLHPLLSRQGEKLDPWGPSVAQKAIQGGAALAIGIPLDRWLVHRRQAQVEKKAADTQDSLPAWVVPTLSGAVALLVAHELMMGKLPEWSAALDRRAPGLKAGATRLQQAFTERMQAQGQKPTMQHAVAFIRSHSHSATLRGIGAALKQEGSAVIRSFPGARAMTDVAKATRAAWGGSLRKEELQRVLDQTGEGTPERERRLRDLAGRGFGPVQPPTARAEDPLRDALNSVVLSPSEARRRIMRHLTEGAATATGALGTLSLYNRLWPEETRLHHHTFRRQNDPDYSKAQQAEYLAPLVRQGAAAVRSLVEKLAAQETPVGPNAIGATEAEGSVAHRNIEQMLHDLNKMRIKRTNQWARFPAEKPI